MDSEPPPVEPPEQRASDGATFQGVAGPRTRTPLIVVLAAFAVLAVGLLTRESAPSGPGQAVASIPPGGPVTEPSATSSSMPAKPTRAGPPPRNPDAFAYAWPDLGPVEAGRVELVATGSTAARVSVDIPKGWHRVTDGWFLTGDSEPASYLSIGVWQVERVFVFPCRWSSGASRGGSMEEKVHALSSWWGQDPSLQAGNSTIAPLATEPEAIAFRGFVAWYLEVLIPSRLDLDECDASQMVLWESADGTPRLVVGAGELNRLWVLDADRDSTEDRAALVIDVATYVTPSDATLGSLDTLIKSITVEPELVAPPTSSQPAPGPSGPIGLTSWK